MTSRELTLRRAIVRALGQCGNYLCPESALRDQVSLGIVPPPTQSDFDAALRALDTERFVISGEGAVEHSWKLTEAGRVWAKEHRI